MDWRAFFRVAVFMAATLFLFEMADFAVKMGVDMGRSVLNW
jgi:hypothetical protein